MPKRKSPEKPGTAGQQSGGYLLASHDGKLARIYRDGAVKVQDGFGGWEVARHSNVHISAPRRPRFHDPY